MNSWGAFLCMAAALGLLPGLGDLLVPPAAAQNRAAAVMKKNDRNGDGRISREEWQGPPPAFGRLDNDGDGFVSREELDARFGAAAPAGGGPGSAPGGAPVKWIDVHTHPSASFKNRELDFSGAVRATAKAVADSPISKVLLMPTPQAQARRVNWQVEDFLGEARKHPARIAVLGGGGSLNLMINADSPDGQVSEALRDRFEKRAEQILRLGAVGFGEMSILHLSLADGHGYSSVAGDHPLFLLLADIAARHGVPIDIHFDLVAEDIPLPAWLSPQRNPAVLKKNIDGFERLLAHNRQARIVWAHAGSDNIGHWTVELTRQMLNQHPNLYMSLRMTPAQGRIMQNHPLTPNGIRPPWLKLFQGFPDRFVIGGDLFFTTPGSKGPAVYFGQTAGRIRSQTELFLSHLPPDLARKIGTENATRLYNLSP